MERDPTVAMEGLAHDARAPIQMILAASRVMDAAARRGIQDWEAWKDCVDSVRQNAYALQRMVQNLVDAVSFPGDRPLSLSLSLISLADFVGDLALRAAPYARDRGIDLRHEVDGAIRTVLCDPDLLERAVLNLLSNALKFTPKGGSVCLRAVPADGGCRIEVSDTGLGIAMGERARVFDRFYRGERDGAGMGLGLYIARGIVMEHGGDIEIADAPGGGAVFIITLPEGATQGASPKKRLIGRDDQARVEFSALDG